MSSISLMAAPVSFFDDVATSSSSRRGELRPRATQ